LKKLSAVLITFNEEAKIGRALASLQGLVDEIVIVDSFSTDETETICRGFTDRFIQRAWSGYREQKQFALRQAEFEWVLSLDADEVLSSELIRELEAWKKLPLGAEVGYYLPRKTFFLGRWIDHTTWYPDWQLRLFRKSSGQWKGRRVHESVSVDGPTARFKSVLEHYTYSTISEFLVQLERFTSLAAADLNDRGVRAKFWHLAVYPVTTFVSNYLVRLGFLDGIPGLAASAVSAISVFFKFLKLWELQNTDGQHGENVS
jgi:glycosyltransferase involved in cell wall biosynthesis